MFDKIKNFFTALVAFIGAILTFFLIFKAKKDSDLDKSFDKARKEYLKENEAIQDDYEERKVKLEEEYKNALEELSSSEGKTMSEIEDKYGKDVGKIYQENKEDPEKFAKKLGELYGLDVL